MASITTHRELYPTLTYFPGVGLPAGWKSCINWNGARPLWEKYLGLEIDSEQSLCGEERKTSSARVTVSRGDVRTASPLAVTVMLARVLVAYVLPHRFSRKRETARSLAIGLKWLKLHLVKIPLQTMTQEISKSSCLKWTTMGPIGNRIFRRH